MKVPWSKPAAIGVCLLLLGAPAAAAQGAAKKPWSASGRIGVQYDDNVTTEETDNTANKSDRALIIEAGAQYRPEFGQQLGLELGYDFSQSLYDELTDFNLQSHSVSAGIEKELNGFDTSLTYLYVHSLLGGNNFLGLHSLTPTVGYSVTDRWYASVRYSFQDKDFKSASNNGRDASVNSVALDNFFFFMESKGYLLLGYRVDREDASSDEFDYLGHVFQARLKAPIPVQAVERWNPVLRLGYEYSRKEYSSVTPSIGTDRLDKRTRVTVGLAADVTQSLQAKLDFEHIESVSNLSTSDYDENIVTLSLGLSF